MFFSTLNFAVHLHSPYSSRVALNDLNLFRYLQKFLAEKMFNAVEEVKTFLSHCFTSKRCDF